MGGGRARLPGVRLPSESAQPLWTHLDSPLLLLKPSVQADPTTVRLGLAVGQASRWTPHRVQVYWPLCGSDSLGHTDSHSVTLNVCRIYQFLPR